MKTFVPPIKSQGIKTKLVQWISKNVNEIEYDRWVEPFMGTGVVAFNVRPKRALLCDSNPHLIKFYKTLQNKEITSGQVKQYLNEEGKQLLETEGEHYYTVRNRFNEEGNPLDFLFLSRSCFNGMMRNKHITKILPKKNNLLYKYIETQQKLIDKLENEIIELKKAQEPRSNYRNVAEPGQ